MQKSARPIDKKLVELRRLIEENRVERIAAEKLSNSLAPAGQNAGLDAEAILVVDDGIMPTGVSHPGADDDKLTRLYRVRDVLLRAEAIANQRRVEDDNRLVQEALAGGLGEEWRALIRQAALAVATLRHVGPASDSLRDRLNQIAPAADERDLPLDVFLPVQVIFVRGSQFEVSDFLDAAVKAGVVTRKEIGI